MLHCCVHWQTVYMAGPLHWVCRFHIQCLFNAICLYVTCVVARYVSTLQTALGQTTRMRSHTLFVGLLTGTTFSHSLKTVRPRLKCCWRHDRDERSVCLWLWRLFYAATPSSHLLSLSAVNVNRTVLEVTDITVRWCIHCTPQGELW